MRTLAILGLGLIGSSVARAARAAIPGTRIQVMDNDAETLWQAKEMSLADLYTQDAAEAVRGAQMVLFAVPVDALVPVARAAAPALAEGAIVTDVASVKRILLEDVAPVLPPSVHLVPAHPIAGSEKSGVQAGSATLFGGKAVILTPEDPEAPGVMEVAAFWEKLQARVLYMPAETHDHIYACVSHLPQLIAFHINAFADVLDVESEKPELRAFFRLTRSSPALWKSIFEHNKDFIDSSLRLYLQVLHQIIGELREGETSSAPPDRELLTSLFARIHASTLISVAQQAELEIGTSLKAYLGTGFRDFTMPALTAPEGDLEAISAQSHAVADLLERFVEKVRAKHS